MDKEKGKSPTSINKELLGGKNTLPTKEGVNEKTLKETIDQKHKELNKPFAERKGIKKTPLEKTTEPPKSKGLGGKGGGSLNPSSFPNRINNKLMLPPKPFVENKEHIIDNDKKINLANIEDVNEISANNKTENSLNIESEEKEKIILAMKSFEIEKPSFLTEQPKLENEIQNENIIENPNPIEEKEKIVLAMNEFENPSFTKDETELSIDNKEQFKDVIKSFETERPSFLNEIEPDYESPEIDFGEPSMDGSDGGGDGGGE